MVWRTIGLNEQVDPITFQNVGLGRGHDVKVVWYIALVVSALWRYFSI